MAIKNMRQFLQSFRVVSNRQSADLDAEGNGTQHVPVVKRLSWAVKVLEASQISIYPWPQRNC